MKSNLVNAFIEQPPKRGLSLYIHVPFCECKCNYCAFYSIVPTIDAVDLWIDAVIKECDLMLENREKPILDTCYFGGGTPSILNVLQWNILIRALEDRFVFTTSTEVTVEVNPNSLNSEQLLCWRDWRVTRVSIGVQSFDDAELQMMGRLHNSFQAHDAISSALVSGFAVSADLIYGLPHQSFKNWARNVKEVISAGVHHISLYQLFIEKGTRWEDIPVDSLSDGYYPYRWVQWFLPQKKYRQYEISNFAMDGYESKHNLRYWMGGDYWGIGPSASGYVDGVRYNNMANINKYRESILSCERPIEYNEKLDAEAAAKEAAILRLRMAVGICIEDYIAQYGTQMLAYIIDKLGQFPNDLYHINSNNIKLTKKGMRVANIIWRELV